ncbi:hypothetical protein KAH51_06645 [Proteus vulgaris]|uniref:hypothetical protein n=1 Tax=Proteus vulgaris TaxID=585 RepID=UPI001B38BFB0|nr:hypothetical protein [Proteus vulgaris]MBQ0213139.1 hypothetical protein [Proteus vulgaris]
MQRKTLALLLLGSSTLLLSGCNSTTGAWDKFTTILSNTAPFIKESQEWEAYSVKTTQQGVVYSAANASDKQFVSNKMDTEYVATIARLSNPFAIGEDAKEELAKENQGYRFKYNDIVTVKDKKTSTTLGYCVNYDSDRVIDGKLKEVSEEDKIRKSFIYIAKDKPVSVATVSADFTKLMCGEKFYNKNKM